MPSYRKKIERAAAAAPLEDAQIQLGHVICDELDRNRCICRLTGKSPCEAMEQAAEAVGRFLREKRTGAASKAA